MYFFYHNKSRNQYEKAPILILVSIIVFINPKYINK